MAQIAGLMIQMSKKESKPILHYSILVDLSSEIGVRKMERHLCTFSASLELCCETTRLKQRKKRAAIQKETNNKN